MLFNTNFKHCLADLKFVCDEMFELSGCWHPWKGFKRLSKLDFSNMCNEILVPRGQGVNYYDQQAIPKQPDDPRMVTHAIRLLGPAVRFQDPAGRLMIMMQ